MTRRPGSRPRRRRAAPLGDVVAGAAHGLVAPTPAPAARRRARPHAVRGAAALRRARRSSRSTTSRSSDDALMRPPRPARLPPRRAARRPARGPRADRLRAHAAATSSSSTALDPSTSSSPRTASTPPSRRRRRAGEADGRTRSPSARSSRARTSARRWPPRARSGSTLVVVGPTKDEARRARAPRGGARLEGYVSDRAARRALPRRRVPRPGVPPRGLRAARASRRWRSGRRSSPSPTRRCVEVAGDAAVVVPEDELADGIRRALAERERLAAAGLERARAFTWEATAEATVGVYVEALGAMSVSAVVVSHGHAAELERAAARARAAGRRARRGREPARLVADRAAGGRARDRERASALASPRTSTSASRRRPASWVLFANPDAVPEPGAVAALAAFAAARPRCGIAGPRVVWPDGTWQPTRRRFPTVGGTLVRRTPLRLLFPPLERQRDHYLLDEDVRPSRSRPTGCSARSCSCAARCSRSSAAGTRATGTTSRTSTSATARCARAGSAGTSRPRASRHDWAQVIDRRFLSRHTLWHAREHGALRPQAPRDAAAL